MKNINELIAQIELENVGNSKIIDETALFNQKKVLDAFRENRVSSRHFAPTNGYGYDDQGRDMLAKLICSIFHTEAAIVSPLIANGTHALSLCLFGILRPGDTMLSVTGKPYDTLNEVIGGKGIGSLSDFGIKYTQTEYKDGKPDINEVKKVVNIYRPKLIFIQRSKGYLWQDALSVEEIGKFIAELRLFAPDTVVMVDNCYGEFTEKFEPSNAGADIIAGSMIKNIGGGLAPTGGYIAGKEQYVDLIARRLTAPSLGAEVGSYFAGYQSFFQGIFLAPSIVKNAMKGCMLASSLFSALGYETLPKGGEIPSDIICAIKFKSESELIEFCRGIQKASPIDSNAIPYPWDMPGYEHQVIMAAGTFVQGGSLELTADAPLKPPYIGYLQGGLTYEHVKLALADICDNMTRND